MNLDNWIRHYQWQKVDHLYLIDNASTDHPELILQPYIDSGYVTLIYCPEPHQQVLHYATTYDRYIHGNTYWLIVCDLDEFFYGTSTPLGEWLHGQEQWDVIYSPWWMFGSVEGEHPDDIRSSVTKRKEEQGTENKYIVKTSILRHPLQIDVHCIRGHNENLCLNTDEIRLNHYPIPSKSFFEVKMSRGDVNRKEWDTVRDWSYFEQYNSNTTYEDTQLKELIKK
jgi:hypothetical protein